MRSGKVLALLSEQERKFERERALWRDERERLLDRIMHLADRPMPEPFQQPAPRLPVDVVDADATLGDDLYLPSVFPSSTDDPFPASVYEQAASRGSGLSPRERMLREDD